MRTVKIGVLVLLISGAIACGKPKSIEQMQAELRQTDSSFSALSVSKGAYEAFSTYADSSVLELSEGTYPIQGLQALKEKYKQLDHSRFELSWKPLRCEVAESGDLGYTFGDYQLHLALPNGADTLMYGNYVSIWKRQADGTWKFVLDGGNGTPGPTQWGDPD